MQSDSVPVFGIVWVIRVYFSGASLSWNFRLGNRVY